MLAMTIKSISVKDRTMQVTDYEIICHGIMLPDYFQGCGTSFTSYEFCDTGTGDNPKDAADSALDCIACSGFEISTELEKECESLPELPSVADSAELDSLEYDYPHYFVSIRFNIKREAPEKLQETLAQLHKEGFDGSTINEYNSAVDVSCSQCRSVVINGCACHESGCYNQLKSRQEAEDTAEILRLNCVCGCCTDPDVIDCGEFATEQHYTESEDRFGNTLLTSPDGSEVYLQGDESAEFQVEISKLVDLWEANNWESPNPSCFPTFEDHQDVLIDPYF